MAAEDPVTTRPNVLVLLSDQQRPDSCGVFGQALPVTPVLDGLADEGVAFDNAFTVQPVCGPARASIQTGRRPTEIGCWRNGLSLPADTPTLAGGLGALGYRTGYIGKWHLASDRGPRLPAGRMVARHEKTPVPPERRGGYTDAWVAADALELTSGAYRGNVFDEDGVEVPLRGYRVDALTDLALDRLGRLADGDDPFLLFVSYLEPHHQNDRLRTIGPKGWTKRFADFEVPGDLVGTLGDWRWNYAAYLASCASIDANLGRLVEALRARGQLDDTLVVFASDHGSHFRTRNLEYKRSCHDASIRIPLVVRGPGFRGGHHDERLVTHLDLLPTLLHAAGGEVDPTLPGAPLQSEPPLSAPGLEVSSTVSPGDARDAVFVQISESQIGRALRTRTHTYSVAAPGWNPLRGHLAPDAARYVETHLYDLVADPYQRHNLVKDPATRELRQVLGAQLLDEIEAAEHTRPRLDPA